MSLDASFLPTGRMRQLTNVSDRTGGKIEGEVDLSRADWIFADHFPGDPVFPGSLLVEAAGLEANVHKRRQMNFGEVSVRVAERQVARIEVVLAVIGTS